jgi:hypothetical protein
MAIAQKGTPLALGRIARRLMLVGPVLVGVLACGCVTTGSFTMTNQNPPAGEVCRVAVLWDKQIAFAPDPVNGGKSTPALLGCMYLYGTQNENLPVYADGTVVVDLYDPAHTGPDGGAVLLEEWRLDRDMLKRLQKHDFIGNCYALVLPWGTYRPDLMNVEMKVRFESGKGLPVYSGSARMPLTRERIDLRSNTRTETLQVLPTAAAVQR